jgi:hypothetical protein
MLINLVMWLSMGFGYVKEWYQGKSFNTRLVLARDE